MSFSLRSLPGQCAALALVLGATSPVAGGQGGQAHVECIVNDFWADRQKSYHVPYQGSPQIQANGYGPVVQPIPRTEALRVVYKSTGAERLRGSAKRRVLRYGVLWLVDPAMLGASESETISALLRAGAVISRSNGDGRVYFRARKADAERLAKRAAGLLGQRGIVTRLETTYSPRRSSRQPNTIVSSIGAMSSSVAMMRVEGRLSRSPLQFIEFIPAGMTVLPYGTSFLVHVRPNEYPALRNYIEQEGNSVLLVGARSEVVAGDQASGAVRSCGGRALSRRFPTPVVTYAGRNLATLDVEGQQLRVAEGDTVLVVQRPQWGRGLEIAVMRFG
ncbi:hypothetical protein [Erythrobacter aureus]|uniref:hypothetical protein n=1 Tax=Erythrobacter aureus TaxID=2182384 RepID=UPI0013B4704A|nr:hypothetical protein [Erythrobacter aureus]